MMKLFSKKNTNWLFDSIRWYRFPRFQKLKDFFAPKQRWLTKAIPKNWCDKDGLMDIFFEKCILHYVEVEKGLQDDFDFSADIEAGFITQEYADNVITHDSQLRKIYNYYKYERPQLLKNLDNAYPEYTEVFEAIQTRKPCRDCYAEVDRIEKEIEEKDTWAMTTIIKLRHYMWT